MSKLHKRQEPYIERQPNISGTLGSYVGSQSTSFPTPNNWYQSQLRGSNAGYSPSTVSSSSSYSTYAPSSRTMAYAKGEIVSGGSSYSSDGDRDAMAIVQSRSPGSMLQALQSRRKIYQPPANGDTANSPALPIPRTTSEQYWAYRALRAEACLTERSGPQLQAKAFIEDQDSLRQKNVAESKQNRIERLERLAIGLISVIALTSLYAVHKLGHEKPQASRSIYRPNFTISLFTEIVENKNSKASFLTTAVFITVLGLLAYAMFKQWLHHRLR